MFFLLYFLLYSGRDMESYLSRVIPLKPGNIQKLARETKLMIRAMIEAAKADGQIEPAERAQIMEALSDAGAEERRFVADLIDAPADMAGLVAAAGDATRAQVYATARMIIAGANGAEKDWLDRLAEGLGLDPATRSALDAAAPGGATA